MKITILSLHNYRLSTSLSYMHKLALNEKGLDSHYVHFPKTQAAHLSGRDKDALVNFCKDADIVGISLMTNFFELAAEITMLIKNRLSSRVIWGGTHPQFLPDDCLKYADEIFLGEADNSHFIDYLKEPDKEHDFILKKHELTKMPAKKRNYVLTEDLDSLPAYTFDEPNFFVYENGNFMAMTDISTRRKYVGNVHYLVSSRGCPYSCSYCCNNAFKKNNPRYARIRKFSINKIIDDISKVIEKNDSVRSVQFGDDDFYSRSLEELRQFHDQWNNRIKLPFSSCATPHEALRDEKMRLLVDAGMNILEIGVQTGSERIRRELYKRPEPNEMINKCIAQSKDYKKLDIFFDFMLDNPWETQDDMLETLEMVLKIKPQGKFAHSLFSLTLYPGTELYEKGVKEGLIQRNDPKVYKKHYFTLQNSFINSCIVLFARLDVPEGVIRWLLTRRNTWPVNLLNHSTRLLLGFYVLKIGLRNLVFKGKTDVLRSALNYALDLIKGKIFAKRYAKNRI